MMNNEMVMAAYLFLKAKKGRGEEMPSTAWHSQIEPDLAWIAYCQQDEPNAAIELVDAACYMGFEPKGFR